MKQKIAAAFATRYPNLKPYQIENSVEKYVDVMLAEIAASIGEFGTKDDQISLSLTEIRKKVGRVEIDGKSTWAHKVLNDSPSTSLALIDFKGNQGRNSRISINPRYEDDIWLALIDVELYVEPISASHCQSLNVSTCVERAGLDSFIEKTRITLSKAVQEAVAEADQEKKRKYIEKLFRNFLDAKRIRQLVVERDGKQWLDQQWGVADSGRYYGRGVNLQRVSKEVRHAALGRCYMYDIKAASYALMTGLVLCIAEEQGKPKPEVDALVDYVKNRSHIRRSIAESIGITEKEIKQVFTSLGFGAKTADNPYSSIRKTLEPKAYKALMGNEQFVQIKNAMDLVRATILDYFNKDEFEFVAVLRYSPTCPRTGKKRGKDQKLAWIYQAMESHVIKLFREKASDEGHEPLLIVHDCVYFKQRLPAEVLSKIFKEIREIYPLAEADDEDVKPMIYPIHTDGYVDPGYLARKQEADQMEAAHKEHMRREKEVAEAAGASTYYA